MTRLKDARPWLCVGRRTLTAITLGRVWGSHTQSGVLTCESVRVLIASNAVGDSGGPRGDVFTADKAW